MKKKKNEPMITQAESVFEMENNGVQREREDPTTSLGTSTMTHFGGFRNRINLKKFK